MKITRLPWINSNRLQHWMRAYQFVSDYTEPNVASKWHKLVKHQNVKEDIEKEDEYLNLVMDDEFPLNLFYRNLKKLTQDRSSA
jgi:hypothetical protein